MEIDPTNAEQFTAWDGQSGQMWTTFADRFDEGVEAYLEQLLTTVDAKPGDTVLDVGCGSGRATRLLAQRNPETTVVGIDISLPQVDLARRRAESTPLGNVAFHQADAQIAELGVARFDVVMSRNGVMFFGDPSAAFTNLARATKSGGRLVAQVWQSATQNPWLTGPRDIISRGRAAPIDTHSAGPLSMSDPRYVRTLLTECGYTDIDVVAVSAPMYFGVDVDDAAQFLLAHHRSSFEVLDASARFAVEQDLRADLLAHHTPRGVCYDSAAWLVCARLP